MMGEGWENEKVVGDLERTSEAVNFCCELCGFTIGIEVTSQLV